MKPMTLKEAADAGYRRTGAGRCGNCQKTGEWYDTPKGSKMFFLERNGMLESHHINDCKKQPLQPSGAPETNGSRVAVLQEIAELNRMISLKLDALIAKERW